MANWKEGEFEIDGMIVNANTKIEEFEGVDKYIVYGGEGIVLVVSAPKNTINFIKGEFFVKFVFSDGKIGRIELRPLLRDYNIPNYPDKEYQEYKWNYCKKMLREAFGEASEENELKAVYEFNEGTIFTSKIMRGHEAYTGGHIDIHFRRYIAIQ